MVGSAEVDERGRVEDASHDGGPDGDGPEPAGLRERAAAQIPNVVNTGDPDDGEVHYERSPASALRLITSIVLGLAILSLAEILPQTSLGLERDLQHGAGTWAITMGGLANAIATTWSVALIVVTIVAGIIARRPRAVLSSCLAAVLAAALIVVVSSTAGVTPDIGHLPGVATRDRRRRDGDDRGVLHVVHDADRALVGRGDHDLHAAGSARW